MVEVGKPVAALSLYRSVCETTINICSIARAEAGKGAIQQKAGNNERAAKAWLAVQENCFMCSQDLRSELVFKTIEGWISQGEETFALNLLELELSRNPSDEWISEFQVLRARIHFLNGDWSSARESSTPNFSLNELNTDRLILWVQSGILSGLNVKDAGIDYLEKARIGSDKEKIDAAYANLHTLLITEKRYGEALNWSKKILINYDPILNPEDWILGQMRVAKSAELAGKSLDALLAHHEAVIAAENYGDDKLTARTFRDKAQFDYKRGDYKSAHTYLQRADSIAIAMISAVHLGREPKSFRNHTLPELDPFDLANQSKTTSTNPGGWPFAAALLTLGLMTVIIRNYDLKRTLRRERLRTMRLHTMFGSENPAEIGDLEAESTDEIVEQLEAQFSSSSPDWERIVSSNALDFDDVIASLEMELGNAVDWVLENDTKAPKAPEGLLTLLSVTLRRLLPPNYSNDQNTHVNALIKNDWSGVRIMFDGDANAATEELKNLFSGSSTSQMWSPVFEQAERMSGRIMLECNPLGGHSVVLDIPHPK
ncbi:MAG: hypothetical protein COA49_07735 [Bacteroidetes bacterium]|nr:MAG: hypothetical protein COA49_07735 [Bacteroidota bacterium]